jgi:hypothetical protein
MTKSRSVTIVIPKVDLRSANATAQLRRAAKAMQQRIAQSPDPAQAARNMLIKEGILTKSGKLSKRYNSH